MTKKKLRRLLIQSSYCAHPRSSKDEVLEHQQRLWEEFRALRRFAETHGIPLPRRGKLARALRTPLEPLDERPILRVQRWHCVEMYFQVTDLREAILCAVLHV